MSSCTRPDSPHELMHSARFEVELAQFRMPSPARGVQQVAEDGEGPFQRGADQEMFEIFAEHSLNPLRVSRRRDSIL
jgi:hypothetical protein